jgi:hypothetical protein
VLLLSRDLEEVPLELLGPLSVERLPLFLLKPI